MAFALKRSAAFQEDEVAIEEEPLPADDEEQSQAHDVQSELRARATKSRAMWCNTCNCVKNFASCHVSRARGQHTLRHATEQELEAHFRRIDEATKRCEASAISALVPFSCANPGNGETREYFIEFGKYRRPPTTLGWIVKNDKKYLEFLVDPKQAVYTQYPNLRAALRDMGLLPEDIEAVRVPRGVNAQAYLRERALALQEKEDGEGPMEAVVPAAVRRRRQKKPRLFLQPKNCGQCGSSEHNAYSCTYGTSAYAQKLAVSDAYRKAGSEARRIASLKYTQRAQVSVVSAERPKQHSAAEVKRCFLPLCRASPYRFAAWMVEDGLFRDLTGTACLNPKCQAEDSVLGKMIGVRQLDLSEEQVVCDISRDTVLYQRRHCRARYSVVQGHPLFPQVGHGAWGPTRKCLAWWSFIEAKTATVTSRELAVDYGVVLEWYREAELITEHDALARQRAMRFGGRAPLTTDIEVDGTCFQSWRVPGEGDRPTRWYFCLCPGHQAARLSGVVLLGIPQAEK